MKKLITLIIRIFVNTEKKRAQGIFCEILIVLLTFHGNRSQSYDQSWETLFNNHARNLQQRMRKDKTRRNAHCPTNSNITKKHTQKSTLEPLLRCNEFVGKASISDTKSITVRNDSHFLNAQGKKSILMQLLSFWPPRSINLLKNENWVEGSVLIKLF